MITNIVKEKIFKVLNFINDGCITIIENGNQKILGNESSNYKIIITVYDSSVYKQLMLYGTNGISDSYISRKWECNDLYGLFDLILKNKKIMQKFDGGIAKVNYLKDKLLSIFSFNSILKAKKNIVYHYDLSNEFFSQFLDKKMMYSCAVFKNSSQNLDGAAEYKLAKICDKLQLSNQDHLLEIGSGWGGLALYAHQHYGCKVTTTTISDAQYEYVKKAIQRENLTDQIEILNLDFRKLSGNYNKIVSIEMIESIGFKMFPTYFKKVNDLLSEGGLFLLQSITIDNNEYERYKFEIDFIKKYIFPGGCLPSEKILKEISEAFTQMQIIDIEDIGLHYVRTLEEWRIKFNQNQDNIKKIGFSASFFRLWEYYFTYCQAGFNNKHISDLQILWKK